MRSLGKPDEQQSVALPRYKPETDIIADFYSDIA
jgi:hypothetical protein